MPAGPCDCAESDPVPLPPLPPIRPEDGLPLNLIRYVAGYPTSFVQQYATDYARAAVLAERYILDLLVAAGHVTAEKVAEAREIAAGVGGASPKG
jgi:hypothetical protein